MSVLADKLRKARTVRVEVGDVVFHVLRPTPLEREERLSGDHQSVARGIMSFVIGWENVTELSMFSGGSPHPLPFDKEACAEWLSDRPDLFKAISTALVDAYHDYAKQSEVEVKN